MHKVTLCRRSFIVSVPLLAAGCVSSERFAPILGGDYGTYGVIYDEGIVVPAVDTSTVDPNLLRQDVGWPGRERPGSIVVKIPERRLYLVQGNGRALRYGIGVGRTEALNFRGSATIGRKKMAALDANRPHDRSDPALSGTCRRHARRSGQPA